MFIEYGELSTRLYDLTKPVGFSINGDLEYYYQYLEQLTGTILEAGVGTGRLMIPYLEKGLDIEGVDLSSAMLAQCEKNMALHHVKGTLYQGDLTKLALKKRYEAIIMPTGSLCLIPNHLILDILTFFYQHLEANGTLIVDLELPTWFNEQEVSISNYPLTDTEGLLFTSTAQNMDWHQQKVSYVHRYELVSNGQVIQTELSHFTLYWYGIQEFISLLEKVGFTSVTYEAGYGKNTQDSLITFFATKPDNSTVN